MGVENYVATLKLTPVTDGDRTFAEWWAEFDCAPERERELAELIGQACSRRRSTALKGTSALAPRSIRVIRVTRSADHRRADRARLGGAARLQQPHRVAPGRRRVARSSAASRPTRSAACATSRCTTATTSASSCSTLSDRDHVSTYCILDATLPMQRYVATVQLKRVTDGDRTFWHWQSTFDAPRGREREFADLVGKGVYEGGFEGLRAYLRRTRGTVARGTAPRRSRAARSAAARS